MYDYLVDIDDAGEGLRKLVDAKPDVFRELLTKGWENCTLNGGGSLLSDWSNTGHEYRNFSSKSPSGVLSKFIKYDSLFCDVNMTAIVYSRCVSGPSRCQS